MEPEGPEAVLGFEKVRFSDTFSGRENRPPSPRHDATLHCDLDRFH